MNARALEHSRWEVAAETLAELAGAETLSEFSIRAAVSFRKLFESDFVTCDTFTKEAALLDSVTCPEEFSREPAYQRLAEPFRKYVTDHPVVGRGLWAAFSHGKLFPHLSDLISPRNFFRTGLYNEVYKHQGVRFQIALGADIDGARVWTAGCGRASRDYRSFDRDLLRFCQPVIASALKRIARHDNISVAAKCLQGFFSDDTQPYIILSTRGDLVAGTSSGLLKMGLPINIPFSPSLQLPLCFHATWKELHARTNSTRGVGFCVLHEPLVGPILLLWLSKSSLALIIGEPRELGEVRKTNILTRRERDVLGWLAEGKTNSEIGMLLRLSRRTVEKHCESIFSKLGVENRLSAALLARELAR